MPEPLNSARASLEEYQLSMDAIVKGAEDRALTDEEVKQYEELETSRIAFTKTEEIRKRNLAYKTPRVTIIPGLSAGVKERDSEEYAWDRYLRGHNPFGSDLQRSDTYAQSEGTTTAGGFLMPTTTLNRLVEITKAFGGLKNEAEVITTASGNPLNWPSIDDTANSAVTSAEGVAAGSGGADLVFTQVTLSAFKYDATGTGNVGLLVSNELLQDSAFDVVALINRRIGIRLARKMANDYCVGTGTTMATGIFDVTGDASQFTTGVITYAGLQKMVHLLDPSYRPNAKWVMNDDVASRIEQILDLNLRPLLVPSIAGISGGTHVTGNTLLGYPVVVDQAAPAWINNYTAVANTGFLLFGDLQQAFIIRDVQGVTVLADPYGKMNVNSIQYFGYARTDSKTQNRKAYVISG
jgi:HK97 family phage major capsid protein